MKRPWAFTLAIKTPITAVANSGAEDPAAMKVAPATSCDICKAVKRKNKHCSSRYSNEGITSTGKTVASSPIAAKNKRSVFSPSANRSGMSDSCQFSHVEPKSFVFFVLNSSKNKRKKWEVGCTRKKIQKEPLRPEWKVAATWRASGDREPITSRRGF